MPKDKEQNDKDQQLIEALRLPRPNISLIQALLSAGADVCAVHIEIGDGRLAIYKDRIVDAFVSNNGALIDYYCRACYQPSAFMLAEDKPDILSIMAQHFMLLLKKAVENENLHEMKRLIHFAPFTQRQSFLNHALEKSVDTYKNEMIKLLLELGADMTANNILMRVLCCFEKLVPLFLEKITALLNKGEGDFIAFKKIFDLVGVKKFPLEYLEAWCVIAVRQGHLSTVTILLEHVTINLINTDGDSLLRIAYECDHLDILTHLRQKMKEKLGATRTDKDRMGLIALEPVVQERQHLQNLFPRLTDGATPLHVACDAGCETDVCRLLVLTGTSVNARLTESGETPLCLAIANGHIKIAIRLLHAGADATLTLYDGRTAMDCAREKAREELVRALIANDTCVADERELSCADDAMKIQLFIYVEHYRWLIAQLPGRRLSRQTLTGFFHKTVVPEDVEHKEQLIQRSAEHLALIDILKPRAAITLL